MEFLTQGKPSPPIRWLAAGILIGIGMAHLGLVLSVLILVGLVILARCKGFNLTLTKNDDSDDR